MELVQAYLDKWQPAPKNLEIHRELIGANRATITDGTDSVEFGFLDYSIEQKAPNYPIMGGIGGGRVLSYSRGRADTTVYMNVLLDDNKVYELIGKRLGQQVTVQTDKFRVTGYVESVDYGGISMMNDDITAKITILSTDFKVL